MWWSHATKDPFWATRKCFLLAQRLQWDWLEDGLLGRVPFRDSIE
jgi:hypothetical protein